MGDQYLVDVAHRKPNLIETFDIAVQTLYNAHKAEISALAVDLRATVDAFWLQMTNEETWRTCNEHEHNNYIQLIELHLKKACRICKQMIDKTDNLIETVKKAACSCEAMRQQCRQVQQAPGQNTMKQWYKQVWIDVRHELRMPFTESFRQHVECFDPNAAELPFLAGALPAAKDEFFHYMDVVRQLENEEKKKINRQVKKIDK